MGFGPNLHLHLVQKSTDSSSTNNIIYLNQLILMFHPKQNLVGKVQNLHTWPSLVGALIAFNSGLNPCK